MAIQRVAILITPKTSGLFTVKWIKLEKWSAPGESEPETALHPADVFNFQFKRTYKTKWHTMHFKKIKKYLFCFLSMYWTTKQSPLESVDLSFLAFRDGVLLKLFSQHFTTKYQILTMTCRIFIDYCHINDNYMICGKATEDQLISRWYIISAQESPYQLHPTSRKHTYMTVHENTRLKTQFCTMHV